MNFPKTQVKAETSRQNGLGTRKEKKTINIKHDEHIRVIKMSHSLKMKLKNETNFD